MVYNQAKPPNKEDPMNKISVEYQVTVSDFRRATYYGLVNQHRTPLRIMVVVIAVAIVYALLGSLLNLGGFNPLVVFLAAAYLVWGILLFAGAERRIRQYIGQKDCLVGCTYRMELESHRVEVAVPERKIRFSVPVNQLACVIELSGMFLIYHTAQDAYILPNRRLTDGQRADLRANFRKKLGERFASRFK